MNSGMNIAMYHCTRCTSVFELCISDINGTITIVYILMLSYLLLLGFSLIGPLMTKTEVKMSPYILIWSHVMHS
jgi:hypothetical protein